MADSFNLTIDQGTDYERGFTVYDNDNAIVDITTFTLAGKMKRSTIGANNTAIPFVITKTDAVNGKANLSLTNIVTDALVPGRYVYDIEITNAGGKIFRVIQGTITVNSSSTKI